MPICKKPAKCITPKRARDLYKLTARDMKHLINLVKEANDILDYYVNMPENETGELATTRTDELATLSEQVDALKSTIDWVTWL